MAELNMIDTRGYGIHCMHRPEPLVSVGFSNYAMALPFGAVALMALSVFGVVPAIDAQAVEWPAPGCTRYG